MWPFNKKFKNAILINSDWHELPSLEVSELDTQNQSYNSDTNKVVRNWREMIDTMEISEDKYVGEFDRYYRNCILDYGKQKN